LQQKTCYERKIVKEKTRFRASLYRVRRENFGTARGEVRRCSAPGTPLLLPLQRAAHSQCLINWVGLYLERLERFSRRALISTISKINISIIIANITKQYGTFMFISIPSTFLRAVSKFSRRTLYIQGEF